MNENKKADKNWILTAYDEDSAEGGLSVITNNIQGQATQTTESGSKSSEIPGFAKEQFEKTRKDAGEYADRLTVSSSSTGDEAEENFVQTYDLDGKKWGVQVEDIELPSIEQMAHTIDVTPEMRQSVMEDQVTFAPDDEISFPDGTVGEITSEADADGRMQIDVILPDGGTRVWNLTADEIKARMAVPENAENVPEQGKIVPEEPVSVPKSAESSGIITGEEATKEVQLYGTRIREWLSGDNLQKAEGMSREEIFEQFGNTPEPIAYVPVKYLSVFGDDVRDNRIYCGKGYFIDHALNHHPEVTMSEYDLIQSVLSEPDAIKRTSPKTIAFTKRIGKGYAALLQFSEEDGKIIYHKSLFWRDKGMPYANKPDIEVKPLVGGRSTISPNEESLAGSLLSALNGSSANIGNFLITSKELESDG